MEYDTNAQLPCELDDDEVFVDRRGQRAALVASMPENDNHERSLARQKRNVNNLMDKTEKLLRTLSRYETDQSQDNKTKRFSDTNKAARLKELRMIWIELRAQDDFLQVARDHGWQIAEKMKTIEGNGNISDARKKIVQDLLRDEKINPSFGGKNRSPRKFSPYNVPAQRFSTPSPWPASPGLFPGAPSPRPMYAPGPSPPPQYPMFNPSQGLPYSPRLPTSKYVKKVDKSKSSCFSCNGVGHWTGDPECPFTQALGQQPTPPGDN